MKLLVIPSWYPSTASAQDGIFIFEQVKALQQSGLDLAVLYGAYQYRNFWQAEKKSFQIEAKIPTFRAQGFFLPKVTKGLIEAWARKHFSLFEEYLERYGPPDLIHAHSYLAGAIALQLAQRYQIPYVLTEHLFRFLTEEVRQRHRRLVREVYDAAQGLVAVSGALRSKMQTYTSTEIAVIPNLVDTTQFRAVDLRLAQNKPTVFLSVGHLHPAKAYGLLIEAFQHFKREREDPTVLKIIGEGTERAALETQIRRLGLAASVQLLGAQDQAKIIEALQEASCFVSSSSVETFGVAIIEALSMGVPVIATRCGGPEEIITPAVGQLVPVNDAKALATAMLRFTPEDYEASTIRRYVEERFSKSIITSRLTAFYQKVLEANTKL